MKNKRKLLLCTTQPKFKLKPGLGGTFNTIPGIHMQLMQASTAQHLVALHRKKSYTSF